MARVKDAVFKIIDKFFSKQISVIFVLCCWIEGRWISYVFAAQNKIGINHSSWLHRINRSVYLHFVDDAMISGRFIWFLEIVSSQTEKATLHQQSPIAFFRIELISIHIDRMQLWHYS